MNIASMVFEELEAIGKERKAKAQKAKLPEYIKGRKYKARRVASKRVFTD